LGVEFLGIMAVTAFMEFRDKKEDGEVSIDGPHVLSREVFQFSYGEQETSVAERFDHWLSNVVLLGLDQWRKQL
jgi:hypothetical protein